MTVSTREESADGSFTLATRRSETTDQHEALNSDHKDIGIVIGLVVVFFFIVVAFLIGCSCLIRCRRGRTARIGLVSVAPSKAKGHTQAARTEDLSHVERGETGSEEVIPPPPSYEVALGGETGQRMSVTQNSDEMAAPYEIPPPVNRQHSFPVYRADDNPASEEVRRPVRAFVVTYAVPQETRS
ncbi:MAG: hypothetical protein M1812_006866 [Candelaria pacifica]|nr:MAG: hypothetical protein M1812_006866 [Candelaria pacifica]